MDKRNRPLLLLALLLLAWLLWRYLRDNKTATANPVASSASVPPPPPPPLPPPPTSPIVESLPGQGTSYYSIAANPGVLDITAETFDGINPANYGKLDAYASTLEWSRSGPVGVYTAYQRLRGSGGPNEAAALAELNAALHAIYG